MWCVGWCGGGLIGFRVGLVVFVGFDLVCVVVFIVVVFWVGWFDLFFVGFVGWDVL